MSTGLVDSLTSLTAGGEDCEPCAAQALAAATLDTAPSQSDAGLPAAAASAFWEGVIGVEGEMTGDGRFIEANALKWQLPMPLRYVRSDVGEHGGAVVAGRILAVERREGGQIWASGDFDMGHPDGVEAERQVREKLTNGISMDLDDVSFELRVAADVWAEAMAEHEGGPITPTPNPDGTLTVAKLKSSDEIRATTDARVRAATIVAIPAFASAQIFSAAQGPVDLAIEAPDALSLSTEGLADYAGDPVPVPKADLDGVMPDGETACSTDPDSPDFAPDCVAAKQKVASPVPPGAGHSVEAIIAAAIPMAPPAAWFKQPQVRQATALTVTEEGRIFGHLAAWGVCHIGMGHQGCVTAPKSKSGYAYFHTGSILTSDGTEVSVGHITLDTTHAPTSGLSAAGAQNHYEVTGHVVADVVAGEDAFGIWVAGALRPRATASQIRELRAAPLSGDWRRVSGGLELVAALAVNVPGFPIPRPKGLVAGGVVQSLVASGMVAPKQVLRPGVEGALSTDDLRYLKQLAAKERLAEQQVANAPIVEALANRVKASALAMRVHATPTIKEKQ